MRNVLITTTLALLPCAAQAGVCDTMPAPCGTVTWAATGNSCLLFEINGKPTQYYIYKGDATYADNKDFILAYGFTQPIWFSAASGGRCTGTYVQKLNIGIKN